MSHKIKMFTSFSNKKLAPLGWSIHSVEGTDTLHIYLISPSGNMHSAIVQNGSISCQKEIPQAVLDCLVIFETL